LDNLLAAILLGIIQGVTEWLPISSTGHLRLTEYYLDLKIPILFDVILHIGTLAVILVFFRSDIRRILSALGRLDFKSEYGQLIPLIVVATIPTALVGLVFGDLIESTFQTPVPIAAALILCGTLLYISKKAIEKTDRISYSTALLIGVAQAIAIIPGISRSGITIVAALLVGLKREKAFRFSFLIAVPAIIGALGLTLYKEHAALAESGFGWTEILVGVAAAMVIGYFALKLVQRTLQRKRFYLFALYCWLLGTILILISL
jgi:undecaprenyl-diphosphatase